MEKHKNVANVSEKEAGNPSFLTKYSFAFVAASCAEIVTYPLDITKTRMQVSTVSTTNTKQTPGMLRTGFGIVKNEGILGLWKGISPAIYRHLFYAGIRIGLYEKIRDDVFGKEADGSFPIYKAALTGFIAGGVAQFSSNPMDLVRVQIQMDGKRRLEGKSPRVKSVFETLMKTAKEGGLKSLWRGGTPNAQRGALVNLGDLMGYDCGKRFLLHHTSIKDGTTLHVLSSFLAGLASSIMATPADVVTTRMMNQTIKDGKGVCYKNSVDCLLQTVRQEGVVILYKGFIPMWIKMGPASLTFWVVYEWLRAAVGVTGF